MPTSPTSPAPQSLHQNYFEVEARTHHELGRQMGQLFGQSLGLAIRRQQGLGAWPQKKVRARSYLPATERAFPRLVEELRGYAQGAGVAFEELWALSLEDELDAVQADRCTTVITNDGRLMAHNEDWDAALQDTICILKKTIGGLTTFELFYTNTLGGNGISINSHGYIQAINSLKHSDRQVGIPRNVIARWLSETTAPEADFQRLRALPRSAGYNHNILSLEGQIWNIECSAGAQQLSRPASPFVHTNHYLSPLRQFEADDNGTGTRHRYQRALAKIKRRMSTYELKTLMSNTSGSNKVGIFNEDTIARMLIDLVSLRAYVWLRREAERGWVPYDLGFAHRHHHHQRHRPRPLSAPTAASSVAESARI